MDLSAVVLPEDVLQELVVTTKADLLQRMVDHAATRLGLPSDLVKSAILARESLGSTGIGEGVAIPHAVLPGLSVPYGLLAILKRPVDFEAIDGVSVDIVFMLLTPAARLPSHLQILSCFARKARSPEYCRGLRNSNAPALAHARLIEN